MLYPLIASAEGRYLAVTTCPSMGLRAQREVAAAQYGGWDQMLAAMERQAAAKQMPLALIDHTGAIVARSAGWPR